MIRLPALVLLLLATACNAPPRDPWAGRPPYGRTSTWSDPETGCQYLSSPVKDGFVLTPRLREDGRPMCPTVGP